MSSYQVTEASWEAFGEELSEMDAAGLAAEREFYLDKQAEYRHTSDQWIADQSLAMIGDAEAVLADESFARYADTVQASS